MSDQKLRDLERRWKETGTVEDEAAYLLERVRVAQVMLSTWRASATATFRPS
jgi:hypothetical protein